MDKKIRQVETCRIFWWRWAELNSCILQSINTIIFSLCFAKFGGQPLKTVGGYCFLYALVQLLPSCFSSKKDILGSLRMDLTPRTQSRQSRVYHQCEALYITDTKCCISSLRKKIQPTADDILALSRYTRQGG